MANNPVVNSITFAGSVAGQASIQSQGIAGGLTFLLPNTAPIAGQLLDVQSINGNNVFLGWVSSQTTPSILLSQILPSGATSGQTIVFNGTNWIPSTGLPGEGTVTSVAVTVPAWLAVAGSPITSAGTIAITSAPSLTANFVLATPNGSSGVLSPRALVAADIPSLPYDASGAAATAQSNAEAFATSADTTVLATAEAYVQTFTSGAHRFLVSYSASTGLFTSAQPASTDLSDVALLAYLASPAFSGTPTAPTASPLTNSTQIATTAYADAAVAVETGRATTAEGLLAPLASPTFTGTVTLPATVNGTASTSLTIAAASGQNVFVNAPVSIELTAIAGHVAAAAGTTLSLGAAGSITILANGATQTSPHGVSIADNSTNPVIIKQQGSGNVEIGSSSGSITIEANAGSLTLESSTGASLTNTASGDIALTQNGTGNITAHVAGSSSITLTTATGVFAFDGTGGGMSLATQNADITIDASGNISVDPASAQTTTLSGIVAISGTSSFTTANPTFFSSQGNGSKVQLSTGGFTNGDVVTQDANGNTIDSGTLLSSLASTASVTAKPNLYDGTGADPAAGDNHIASGSATLAGTTGVTVTLTGSAVFADTNYVVQVTRTQVTAHTGASVYVTVTDGANFTIFSDAAGDTGTTVAWTAIGF